MSIRYIFITTFSILLAVAVQAQESPGLRERAAQLYREYKYAQAAPIYQKLVDVKKPRLSDLERLADSYRQMNDYEAAKNWYARVVAHDGSTPENLLLYGEVLKANANYEQAKQVFQEYATKTGDKLRVEIDITGCDSAQYWLANPTFHRLNNESAINTDRAEFGAFAQNNTVYYTGEPFTEAAKDTYGWTGQAFLQVYSADRKGDGSLGAPIISHDVFNQESYHNGPIIGNKAGDTYYVTRTYPDKQGAAINREEGKKYRTHKLELYRYHKTADGTWQIEPFAYNNVAAYSLGHATLSADEQLLYFVSDMHGSIGGTDIWYSERQTDGSWGTPQNAGSSINTSEDEMFPNIAPNGVLYYSSNGLPGMGGLDIFRSEGSKSSWTKPQNMRYPVNSAGDDFAYVTQDLSDDGFRGYLSSNRSGGRGSDDIYSFRYQRPKIILALKGITYNKTTNEVLPSAAVSLYANGRELKAKKNSDQDGTFFFELDKNTAYTVLGQKIKFHADSAIISTEGITVSDTLEVALYLEPIFEKGKRFTLENIHYNFDKDNIRPDAVLILDELVRTLQANPTLKIELSSHTDSRGSDAYNMDLSQRRAQSAVDYLVSRGIARDRMVAKGYGEQKLLNRCSNGVACSIAEHQANRRTEVEVLSF